MVDTHDEDEFDKRIASLQKKRVELEVELTRIREETKKQNEIAQLQEEIDKKQNEVKVYKYRPLKKKATRVGNALASAKQWADGVIEGISGNQESMEEGEVKWS